jgi:ribonuclease P protein subunit RPR2
MKQGYRNKPQHLKEIARERIGELFSQAELRFKKNPELSDRYVELARKISMKYKVRIPRESKRRFCKHCHKYIVPGANSRVRLTDKKIVYTCFNCKKHMRFPVK